MCGLSKRQQHGNSKDTVPYLRLHGAVISVRHIAHIQKANPMSLRFSFILQSPAHRPRSANTWFSKSCRSRSA